MRWDLEKLKEQYGFKGWGCRGLGREAAHDNIPTTTPGGEIQGAFGSPSKQITDQPVEKFVEIRERTYCLLLEGGHLWEAVEHDVPR